MVDGVVACDEDFNLALFNRTAREWHGFDAMAVPAEKWAEDDDLYCADGVTPMTVDTVPLARAFRGDVLRDEGMVIRAKGQSRAISSRTVHHSSMKRAQSWER